MAEPTRWVTDTEEGHSKKFVERFRNLAAEGADLAGEARLVDAMLAPHSRVLDAGCGTGRVGAVLYERGHEVVGVDADAELVEAARIDHEGPTWLIADLSDMSLAEQGISEPFDGIVMAGNVMPYVAPGSEVKVLHNLANHLHDDGFVIVGFGLTRGYALKDFDEHVSEAGLRVEQRFATWSIQPWHDDAEFAVTVLRHH